MLAYSIGFVEVGKVAIKNLLVLFSISIFLSTCITYPITTISFFIRTYVPDKTCDCDKILSTIRQPGKMPYKCLRNHLDNGMQEGIFSSYWGYLTVSDFMGQVRFPRKQPDEKLKLLITERIVPMLMIGNTIHHWQLDPTVDASLYTLERIQDAENKKFYWNVARSTLPVDNRVHLDTIIIFAKPKDICVLTGQFETTDNPQLVLPDIYAKKTLNTISPALWILKMRQFYGPIKTTIKKISDTYYSEQLLP